MHVDKQLGLKLEEQQVPTPVMVVDSVNEQPSDNPPDLAKAHAADSAADRIRSGQRQALAAAWADDHAAVADAARRAI